MNNSAEITYIDPVMGKRVFFPGSNYYRLFTKFREIMDFNHPLKLLFNWLVRTQLFQIDGVLQALEWVEPLWDEDFDQTVVNITLKEIEDEPDGDMLDKLIVVGRREMLFCKGDSKSAIMAFERMRVSAFMRYAPRTELEIGNVDSMLALAYVVACMCRRSNIKPCRTPWQKFKNLFRAKWKQLV